VVELGGERLHGGQLRWRVALGGDALAPDFRGTQAGVPTRRATLGVCLALAIDAGLESQQQMREMVFGAVATSGRKGIETRAAALSLMRACAEGTPVPTQCAFRATLAAWSQFFDRPRHKESAGAPFEGLGGLHEQGCERVGELHTDTSSMR
jgi:hypothetical protein